MSDYEAIVREGAHFYMAHHYTPNGDGTDRHVLEGCKGCAAEAALDALVKERDSWRTLAEGRKLTDDVERHRV